MYVEDGALRDFLISSGLMTRSQLADALVGDGGALRQAQGKGLYDTLVGRGIISQDELRRAAAHVAGVTFVLLKPHDISPQVLELIPEPISRLHNVVAYRLEGNVVEVAMLDLSALEALGFLREQHSLTILPRLTTADSIKRTLFVYQKYLKEKFKSLLEHSMHAVDALLHHALLSHATGVHLDLREAGLLVRYRIQGILREAMFLPKEAAHIIERLKELANLSLTLNAPQEGRFRAEFAPGQSVGVRVASTPATQGERVVLHLTQEGAARQGFTFESLGLHGKALEDVHALVRERAGLILVSGPEGAGKTTTLYTLLDELGERAAAVATIEDEIEYTLPHVAQTKVRPEIGLTTASGLRALLKQDPDIVMVGEIRDEQTAALAASAASRGILVLAGIEAQSAAGAIDKLRSLGVPAHLLASVLLGVVDVEVVKKLCVQEKEEYRLSRAEGEPLEARANFGRVLSALKEEEIINKEKPWKEILFPRAVSCDQCESGYKGLVGLQEVLPVSSTIKDLLSQNAPIEDIEARAREEGMLTIPEDGLFKAVQGLTSVEEVVRVTQA